MVIDKIEKGIVIDHITKGKAMDIYNFLNLENANFTVAIIKNAKSKNGKKDLLKIENTIDIDMNILGYLDPNVTVNIIENGEITEKLKLSLPTQIENVIKCNNPRCITSVEQDIIHKFKLVNKETQTYRCVYCETKAKERKWNKNGIIFW